ncbi:hypothetical protein HMPREF0591_5880 [Mycobacterium parascrofulaceum ATCC BAA-614]|uniref:Uncharacterized protein n=1 Tax=Mycobacterium parascrofulaceum ATCC BAA-614 TaxID=525368 RepID=D5PI86_9MYCO|nr:hypothetical protein HMPREF0591_5880 [Mycobacterium parascrofulaceum ATCC BAA-614]
MSVAETDASDPTMRAGSAVGTEVPITFWAMTFGPAGILE